MLQLIFYTLYKENNFFQALKEMAENVFTINWNKYRPGPKKENFIWSPKRRNAINT